MNEQEQRPFKVPTAPPQGPEFCWFHIILSPYAAWLYGDPRGFRTRHHREHVEGDYKNPPPPGTYGDKEQRSRESLKQAPVQWDGDWRPVIGLAVVERLQQLGAFPLCAAVAKKHLDLLVKTPRNRTRAWCGLAKKHAWFVARDRGWSGKMWGKRGKYLPVKDREHQLNVYRYILRHARQGAWVWKWQPPAPAR